MKILDEIADSVVGVVDYVLEKNRKSAIINRTKILIRNEEQKRNRAYIALGKYYYRNHSEAPTPETEACFRQIEEATHRIGKAVANLEKLDGQEEDPCACCSYEECGGSCENSCSTQKSEGCPDCGSDCEECLYEEGYDSAASLKDLRELDGVEEDDEEILQDAGKMPEEMPDIPEEEPEVQEAGTDSDNRVIPFEN